MAATAAGVFNPQLPINKLTAPVSSIMAANESRQSPIRIKRSAVYCFRPGGFAAPEKRWCRFVSNGYHRLMATGYPAPTPGWLTLQAIRFYCSGDGGRHPIQTDG
jgi:hypothetical protein